MEPPGSWAMCVIGATLVLGVSGWLALETSRAIHERPTRAPWSPRPASLVEGPRPQVVAKDRNLLPLLAIERAGKEAGSAPDLRSVLAKYVELEGDASLTAQAVGKKLERLRRIGLARRTHRKRYVLTEEGREWLDSARRDGQVPD